MARRAASMRRARVGAKRDGAAAAGDVLEIGERDGFADEQRRGGGHGATLAGPRLCGFHGGSRSPILRALMTNVRTIGAVAFALLRGLERRGVRRYDERRAGAEDAWRRRRHGLAPRRRRWLPGLSLGPEVENAGAKPQPAPLACRLPAPVSSDDACAKDADCAPAEPCHARACVAASKARPRTPDTVCTMSVDCSSADVNRCACYEGRCALVPPRATDDRPKPNESVMRYFVKFPSGREIPVDLTMLPTGEIRATIDGRSIEVDAYDHGGAVHVAFGGKSVELWLEGTPPDVGVIASSHRFYANVESERSRALADVHGKKPGGGANLVTSPMPGRVLKVLVAEGDEIQAGRPLVVVEAMKMENELSASRDGKVKKVFVTPGATVEGGAKLVELE